MVCYFIVAVCNLNKRFVSGFRRILVEMVCLDLEGVLVPEIWISFAEETGITALRATTRDIPDYNELMQTRLAILRDNNLTITDIQRVIAKMKPFDGAKEFVNWIRCRYQLVILSDTYYAFANHLMSQLDWPTLFCHNLDIAESGVITGYNLRLHDHKRKSVEAFTTLNFRTVAAGDSYNDIGMLEAADTGIFFCPPENIVKQFPNFCVTVNYEQLKEKICDGMNTGSSS